jgi:hypothetical protein
MEFFLEAHVVVAFVGEAPQGDLQTGVHSV